MFFLKKINTFELCYLNKVFKKLYNFEIKTINLTYLKFLNILNFISKRYSHFFFNILTIKVNKVIIIIILTR